MKLKNINIMSGFKMEAKELKQFLKEYEDIARKYREESDKLTKQSELLNRNMDIKIDELFKKFNYKSDEEKNGRK